MKCKDRITHLPILKTWKFLSILYDFIHGLIPVRDSGLMDWTSHSFLETSLLSCIIHLLSLVITFHRAHSMPIGH